MLQRIVLGLTAFAALSGLARGAEPPKNPRLWEPKTTSVTVFKNGLGFFLREGEVGLREGWAVAGQVPPAAYGTLAVFAQKGGETVDIVGSGDGEQVRFDGRDAPAAAEVKRARLAAAIGLDVELASRRDGKDRVVAGRLDTVGETFAVLQGEANDIAVPLAELTGLRITGQLLRIHVAANAGPAPTTATLAMAYLSKGIAWIPEYTLELHGEDSATLTLRGTLINEAEDLIHCDVNFVVGSPRFAHSDMLAPIAAGQAIRAISAAVFDNNFSQQLTNFSVSNAAQADVNAGEAAVRQAIGNLPQWDGAGGGDIAIYKRSDLTLRRGEKAIVTLFTKEIKLSHLYRWSVPAELEHVFVLENSTDTPWTTGPCLAISNGAALSEDLLKYTPRGGRGELPAANAVNLAHEKSETETDRKLKAHEPASTVFADLVTVSGTLRLRNQGDSEAQVAITLPIAGRPLAASDGGAMKTSTDNLKLMELAGQIEWSATVPAGGTKELSYRYERYVLSR